MSLFKVKMLNAANDWQVVAGEACGKWKIP
jgi:hypothetical protein